MNGKLFRWSIQDPSDGSTGHAKEDASPAPTVRKLIGHSGPVYSLSFDPLGGSVAPPQHLLSSSQDGTVRLWGLETYKNLVVYKGHTDPVWAVEWGPLGAYFATASRDRTARLWVTDRVTPLRMFAGHLSDVDVSSAGVKISLTLTSCASVPEISPKLTISCNWVERQDVSIVGCTTRRMCSSFLGSQRRC